MFAIFFALYRIDLCKTDQYPNQDSKSFKPLNLLLFHQKPQTFIGVNLTFYNVIISHQLVD